MPVSSRLHYLLLIACSNRKRSDHDLLPALERYNGGAYRVLRRARREGYYPTHLTTLVLSAKYGLIDIASPIAYYDQRMDPTRAEELRPEVHQVLAYVATREVYNQVYVDMGAGYLPGLPDLGALFQGSHLIYASGRIGERLVHLK